jgi:hypothetical protein
MFTGQRERERERERERDKERGRERERGREGERERGRESCMHVQAESVGMLLAFLIQSISQSVSQHACPFLI